MSDLKPKGLAKVLHGFPLFDISIFSVTLTNGTRMCDTGAFATYSQNIWTTEHMV